MCATILCTFSIKHWRAVEMNPRDGGVPSDTKLLIPFEKIYSGKYKNKTLQTIWNQEKISRVLTTTSLLPQYKSGTLYLNDIFFYCYTTQTVTEEIYAPPKFRCTDSFKCSSHCWDIIVFLYSLFQPKMLYDYTDFVRVLHTLSKLSNCQVVRDRYGYKHIFLTFLLEGMEKGFLQGHTVVSDTVFYALSHCSLGFALHC